jgi:hypothetical protein
MWEFEKETKVKKTYSKTAREKREVLRPWGRVHPIKDTPKTVGALPIQLRYLEESNPETSSSRVANLPRDEIYSAGYFGS